MELKASCLQARLSRSIGNIIRREEEFESIRKKFKNSKNPPGFCSTCDRVLLIRSKIDLDFIFAQQNEFVCQKILKRDRPLQVLQNFGLFAERRRGS